MPSLDLHFLHCLTHVPFQTPKEESPMGPACLFAYVHPRGWDLAALVLGLKPWPWLEWQGHMLEDRLMFCRGCG